MHRFKKEHPDLVTTHVRKIAHHMWGPISAPFLRACDAYLYIVPNGAEIIGYGGEYDDFDAVFMPDVVNWLSENGGRIHNPGYAVTGVEGFIYITATDGEDWHYTADTYANRFDYMLPDYILKH